ncbi:hypothetical protein L0B53_03720 [Vibrio sp. SS-MA-C1-2]|uniref:hypothetical protein n=1 Tax=Vibrio sp. SS-MA-C1-2 TaxID=2908646 RepID=UPI001F394AD2|nr:hypothetical protein [Vibrio sp. SS-MA-C1-2]UJF17055.1 hypothetical protein L0B53_03720 [Vibrio sp. SS-MA-C1-2]
MDITVELNDGDVGVFDYLDTPDIDKFIGQSVPRWIADKEGNMLKKEGTCVSILTKA